MRPDRPLSRLLVGTIASILAGGMITGLAGCTGETPAPTPTTSRTANAPIFESDEEALAAAEAAYAAYLEVSTLILNEGGINPERILPVVTDEAGAQLSSEYESMAEHGYRTTGRTTADRFRLIQFDSATGEVETYACIGVGDTTLLDRAGADITPADREAVVPVVLRFEQHNATLLLAKSETWTGSDFCA